MNYELAKKLKDAGFPGIIIQQEHIESYPTLTELIEACGLKNMLLMKSGNLHQAFDDDNTFCMNQGEGSTPEEAVANLWLALNSK